MWQKKKRLLKNGTEKVTKKLTIVVAISSEAAALHLSENYPELSLLEHDSDFSLCSLAEKEKVIKKWYRKSYKKVNNSCCRAARCKLMQYMD